jgi:phosphatidylglycerol:prolipoprotein diacylglycerol transferase
VFPFHVRFGPFAISPVELFAVAGIVLAGLLARRKMSPQPTPGGLLDLILAAIVGGAIGARLFHFIPRYIRGLETLGRLFSDWSQGSGFVGGLLGGTAAVLLVARMKKLALLNVADVVGMNIPLGFASGKFGCFLAGCCYGPRRDGFPGMTFAPGSLAYETQLQAHEIAPGAARSLPVHPTQLYELVLGVVLFLVLREIHRRSRRPGETYLSYVLGYSVWRFVIEFFRSDPGRRNF